MKIFKPSVIFSAYVIAILFMSLSSCEKNDDTTKPVETPNYTIQGLWTGTITNASSSQFYSLSIKPDGSLTFEGFSSGQEQFGAGTWTLTGSDFVANVKTLYGFPNNVGVQQKLTAKFDTTTGKFTDGKCVNTSSSTDAGTFSLTEVN
jgi:hypothetical protein